MNKLDKIFKRVFSKENDREEIEKRIAKSAGISVEELQNEARKFGEAVSKGDFDGHYAPIVFEENK